MKKLFFYPALFFAVALMLTITFHTRSHAQHVISKNSATVLPDTNSVDTATCDPNIRVQKWFCPNCDDINDQFHPIIQGDTPESIEMSIFDRWGAQVYYQKSKFPSWHGETSKGDGCAEGVYYWTLTMIYQPGNEKEKCAGFVTLKR